jgi:hypothetical protein
LVIVEVLLSNGRPPEANEFRAREQSDRNPSAPRVGHLLGYSQPVHRAEARGNKPEGTGWIQGAARDSSRRGPPNRLRSPAVVRRREQGPTGRTRHIFERET